MGFGSGGHNVKSAKEKAVTGTSRKSRDSGRMENHVVPVEQIPMPAEFDQRHADVWGKVIALLKEHNNLFKMDGESIAQYVRYWILAADAWAQIQKHGITIWRETPGGKVPMKNPACSLYLEFTKVLIQLGDRFGFTPRSRMGIKVNAPQGEVKDPFAEIFKLGKN